jgi:hypothetical protein
MAMGLLLTLAAAPTWAQSQRMAVPSYFGPGSLWTKMATAAPHVGLTIINPNSGPGDTVRADYVDQVKAMQAKGVRVLGYVHTSYGKRPIAEVQTEVDRFNQWYHVDGIFFDECSNDDASLPYYDQCRTVARAGHPKAIVMINPGTPVTEGYMNVADVILTFESDYNAYLKRAPDAAWVAKYPARRFMHLIYGAPDAAAMRKAIQLGKKWHAGWMYVTPDTLPNPWDTLPEGAYWSGELKTLGAAK